MRLVLGPYDLVFPSPAAALSLALASDGGGVVTLPPAPLEGSTPDTARAAADRAPRYLELLDTWRWTAPLWRSGLLRAESDGESPLTDVRSACAQIANDPSMASLGPLVGTDLFADPERYLDLLSRDLLRGGSNPAVAIPLHSGMERFAARRALPLVRRESRSLAGRFGRRSSPPFARFTVPLILGAAPRATLTMRTALQAPLDGLRSTLTALIADPHGDHPRRDGDLRDRAADFATAFDARRSDIFAAADRAAEPARAGEVAVTLSLAPADASLRAAAHAFASLARSSSRAPAPPAGAVAPPRAVILTAREAPWDVPSHR